MEQFITFVLNHWMLWFAFAVVLGLIIGTELRPRLIGVPFLSPQEATNEINHNEAVVIDLRDQKAFAEGHIVDSININFESAQKDLNLLSKYKGKSVILVCANAQQSMNIGNTMRKNGFEHVSILKEGMVAWQNANLPLVK